MTNSMGALSPYEIYDRQVKPLIEKLEEMRGTVAYYDFYKVQWPNVEEVRQQYQTRLPTMKWFVMLTIASDYYRRLGYDVERTDGTDQDDRYNIDLIATKNNSVVVAQVKAGAMSGTDVRKFCGMAPDYIANNFDRKSAELHVIAPSFDSSGSLAIADFGKQLLKDGLTLIPVLPEVIIITLPEY